MNLRQVKQKSFRIALSGLTIAGSVVGAWLVIENSKITEEFLITKEDIASGSPLRVEDLERAPLALFSVGRQYLKPDQLPVGAYLTRAVSAGEAIPKAAVTTQFLDDWSNIVVTPAVELSSSITPGVSVTVWASPALDFQIFGEPVVAAVDAEVVEIREPTDNFAGARASVEVRVPRESIQTLLRAIANGDSIALTSFGTSLG